MKNYVVIVTKNTANEIFATFHKVETLDTMAKAMLEVSVNNAQELPTDMLDEDMRDRTYPVQHLTPNTIYVFQFDDFSTTVEYNCATNSDSAEEHLMRLLGFRKCDSCGAWVSPQDIRTRASSWDGTTRLCPTCIANQERANASNPVREISQHPYHHSHGRVSVINAPGENFDLSNVLGLGIEMEFNSHNRSYRTRNGKIKATPAFYAIAGDHTRNRHFFCEQDCTVAAEFVSNIFTKKSMYDFDWNVLTDQLKLMGNDESIPSVGFHVHLSKAWLGENTRDQALNFLKLQYILKAYENDWLKISGRRPNEMGWCSFYSMQSIERMKTSVLNARQGEEWYAFSCSHNDALISSGNTIELRIGKSTNDADKIKHYLRLVLGIVENLKNVRFEKIYCMGRIFKQVPSETMNYWRKNGCFLNTVAAENRGITVSC